MHLLWHKVDMVPFILKESHIEIIAHTIPNILTVCLINCNSNIQWEPSISLLCVGESSISSQGICDLLLLYPYQDMLHVVSDVLVPSLALPDTRYFTFYGQIKPETLIFLLHIYYDLLQMQSEMPCSLHAVELGAVHAINVVFQVKLDSMRWNTFAHIA